MINLVNRWPTFNTWYIIICSGNMYTVQPAFHWYPTYDTTRLQSTILRQSGRFRLGVDSRQSTWYNPATVGIILHMDYLTLILIKNGWSFIDINITINYYQSQCMNRYELQDYYQCSNKSYFPDIDRLRWIWKLIEKNVKK